MLRLSLDVSDVILRFAVRGPVQGREAEWPAWTAVDFSLRGRFIDYVLTGEELLTAGEVAWLRDGIDDLLGGRTGDDRELEFMEPDLSFRFHPARRRGAPEGEAADRAPYAELTVRFWLDEGGLGGNSLVLTLKRDDLEALLVYLKTVTGRLAADDAAVLDLLRAGRITEEQPPGTALTDRGPA